MGAVEEGGEVDPHIKRNMKKREAPLEDEDPRLLPSGNPRLPELNSTPVNVSVNGAREWGDT